MKQESVNVEELQGKIIEYEPKEGRSLMVKVFGLGTVEIVISSCDENPCLDLYVHQAGKMGYPISSMRTFFWGVEILSDEEEDKQH